MTKQEFTQKMTEKPSPKFPRIWHKNGDFMVVATGTRNYWEWLGVELQLHKPSIEGGMYKIRHIRVENIEEAYEKYMKGIAWVNAQAQVA